jgi:hypothetical protein
VEESSRSSNTSGKPPQLVRALALPSTSTRSYPRNSKPAGMPYGGGWCGFRYTQRRLNSPVLGSCSIRNSRSTKKFSTPVMRKRRQTALGRKKATMAQQRNTIEHSNCWRSLTGQLRPLELTLWCSRKRTFRNRSGTSFHAKLAIVPPGGSRRQFEGLQHASGHHRVSNTDTPCQVVPRVALVVGV